MKVKNILKIVLLGIVFAGCSVIGYRNTEEPKYEVLKKDENIEIREYGPVIVAEVSVSGNYEETTGPAFKKLADYIFGKNQKKESISMTAPVVQEKSEKIAMTAPVFQQKGEGIWIMQFTMPAKYTLETIPKPLDPEITIKELPAKKVAVIRYSGFLNEKNIEANSEKLMEWIRSNGYKANSAPRSAGYDPPWTVPMLRRNEIQVDIEEEGSLKIKLQSSSRAFKI